MENASGPTNDSGNGGVPNGQQVDPSGAGGAGTGTVASKPAENNQQQGGPGNTAGGAGAEGTAN